MSLAGDDEAVSSARRLLLDRAGFVRAHAVLFARGQGLVGVLVYELASPQAAETFVAFHEDNLFEQEGIDAVRLDFAPDAVTWRTDVGGVQALDAIYRADQLAVNEFATGDATDADLAQLHAAVQEALAT